MKLTINMRKSFLLVDFEPDETIIINQLKIELTDLENRLQKFINYPYNMVTVLDVAKEIRDWLEENQLMFDVEINDEYDIQNKVWK